MCANVTQLITGVYSSNQLFIINCSKSQDMSTFCFLIFCKAILHDQGKLCPKRSWSAEVRLLWSAQYTPEMAQAFPIGMLGCKNQFCSVLMEMVR